MRSTKTYEKIAIIFIALLVLFLLFSSYGVQIIPGQNFLVTAARAAGAWWKLLGTLFLGATVYVAVKVVKDDWDFNAWTGLVILALFALTISANIGFSYPYNF